MNKRLSLASLFLFCCVAAVQAAPTERLYLSGTGNDHTVEWDFFCTGGANSGKWTKIAVPSCWELQGFGAYNYGRYSEPVADEKGLYKYSFDVPAKWKGMNVQVVFEGSMTDTEIKINGRSAGDVHQGAFYRFKRDITGLLKYGGRNLIEVTVSKRSSNASVNEAERSADFWVFGGIFRPVYLEANNPLFIDHCMVNARAEGEFSAKLALSASAPEAAETRLTLKDMKGNVVGKPVVAPVARGSRSVELKELFSGIEAWSSEYPNLYNAEFSLVVKGKEVHTVVERIGFRTVELRPRDGIYVNGVRTMFKGVNRGSFYPSSGRTTSQALSLSDALLIKEMNMNAVRMSHYPPDKHFLEVCDSLGLYVIDELCAWQSPPYDDHVGAILAREMLVRDVNHPCVVVWANGNEGGFNFNFDPIFDSIDPQGRPVIHPWSLFRGINTQHYVTYNSGLGSMFNGREIFMPTELIHGLYDGGHGAGLDDFWNLMRSNPLSAGMFLWDFVDQGLVRVDQGGRLDTWTNYGADGILGPYREKEGSFFTIKEIWSPVYVAPKAITPSWDGRFAIENRFDQVNTSQCSFRYKLVRYNSLRSNGTSTLEGSIPSPDVAPGNTGSLQVSLPARWGDYDLLYLTCLDHNGRELFTYSYPVAQPRALAKRFAASTDRTPVRVDESAKAWVVSCGKRRFTFDRGSGYLTGVKVGDKDILFGNGPRLVSDNKAKFEKSECRIAGDSVVITTTYVTSLEKAGSRYRFVWTVRAGGVLDLSFSYRPASSFYLAGVTFDYPEEGVTGAELLAQGPYRVYKNRMKGGTIGFWDKRYNNTVTGESWDYPEFKGFYANLYAVRIESPTPFTVLSHTEDLFLHLFTPEPPKGLGDKKDHTSAVYPAGNISFLHGISPVGNKFGPADGMGPQSQEYGFKANPSTVVPNGKLTFLF